MSAEHVPYIERTRDLYAAQTAYRWVHSDDAPPWTSMPPTLSGARVALIASGGIHRADQAPFHFREDTSHRAIPVETPTSELRVAHFGYDIRDARVDPGCVFPLAALRELERRGEIGSVADPAWTFMGGIYSARRVREEVAPRLRDLVLRQEADLAYLVPA